MATAMSGPSTISKSASAPSELRRLGSLPMCIAIDKSGSTYGATLAAELNVARELAALRQDPDASPAKLLPWSDEAYEPIEMDSNSAQKQNFNFGSGGGTDPSSLYSFNRCLEALQSAGIWVLMTDGQIYDNLVEKFAAQTTEVGIHNKPCVIVVFGDTSRARPGACDISVGICVYAVVPDCLFLFHDVPSGIVRIMQAKGKFKELLPLTSDGDRVKLVVAPYTVWAELPRVAYKDLFNVELSTVRALDPEEMALQDGLIVNIPDMLAGKVDEAIIESIVHNSDNVRSLALSAKTKGHGKRVGAWLRRHQKALPRKPSLPEDVDGKANRAINQLLDALQVGEPEETLEDLRCAVRIAHETNMMHFWKRGGKADESESEIRRRNLRLRNAARVASASPDGRSAPSMPAASPQTASDPFAYFADSNPTYPLFLPGLEAAHFTPISSLFGTSPDVPQTLLPTLQTDIPAVASKYSVGTCGYDSGASDREHRALGVSNEMDEAPISRDYNAEEQSRGRRNKRKCNNDDDDDDDESAAIASRIIRRRRAQRSRSTSVCRDGRGPLMVPNFRRHSLKEEFWGRCMFCHKEDVLTLLLKRPPQASTQGFPREGSETKIAFPLAMGCFAEMKALSSFISCDSCAHYLLRIGTCPTSETIIGALCLASFSHNKAAVLENIDLVVRGRFDKADLIAISVALLDAHLIETERNSNNSTNEDKDLFRRCVEWAITDLVKMLEVPSTLSLAFAGPGQVAPLPTLLTQLLTMGNFSDPSHVDNTELLLLRYPIPGFLVLLRILYLMHLITAEQTHALMFQKVMFLVIEHFITRRMSPASRLSLENLLTDSGTVRTSILIDELNERGLWATGSLQSLENGPHFDTFKQGSGPALAVFLHHLFHEELNFSTAAGYFNSLKVTPALRNLFVAPLGISSGLAADMIAAR
ncbi:hypothetical protein QBC40DRAFT_99072 [Triangularia verruculosa]|uniref:Uncharacterized protein n=1 Tax=Triangularia verruculosa TaxID=2587418 RepID=A0AAN6XC47_9PEZI|nr:hypothetical protein QBC40DRAFT_99072 [Triangularia verruculosa]